MDIKKNNNFIIIPAEVRYDKDIPANAKLIYGEIASLCFYKGYCWATNGYFARLYGVDKVTVSRWLAILKNKGYIFFDCIDKNINPLDKNINAPRQICVYPLNKNINHNIKDNIKNNIYARTRAPDRKKKNKTKNDFSAYDLDLYEDMINND